MVRKGYNQERIVNYRRQANADNKCGLEVVLGR